jgi:hypothetical protein
MNKFKVLAVAVACLVGGAFAGGDLWDFAILLDATNCGKYCGQVHTPGANYCWSQTEQTAANGYGRPCFKGTGGWWFGYAAENGSVKDANSSKVLFREASCNDTLSGPTPEQSLGTIAIEKYIEPSGQNKDWIPSTVAGATTGTAGKHYLIKGYGLGAGTDGLDVIFSNPGGTDEKPNVAAIAFNWRGKKECGLDDFETSYTENLKNQGDGLCVVYKADKAGVDVELGWNESKYEFNTWVAKLPAASDWKTVNIKWEVFGPSYEGAEAPYPLETALTEAEALKFALKTKTSSSETVHFQLKEVGWYGKCSGTATELPSPITSGKMASSYKFNLNGRTLSANFAGSVQVINLQGKIVVQKTLAANESLNLANVPVGIYMVRSESRGIVQKIMVK